MNNKVVAVILLVMLVTATGTVAAVQYSTTRQSELSMVRTYNSDDSDAGRIVPYTVKPVTNPQIQRGDAFIPGRGIINPRYVTEKRNVYTGWRSKINIYSKPVIPMKEELEADNPVTTDNEQLDFVVVKRPYYDPDTPEYVPGEFIVKFKTNVSEETINAINKIYDVSVKATLPLLGLSPPGPKVLSVPMDKSVEEMVALYANLSEVEYACPNGIGHIAAGKISILDE